MTVKVALVLKNSLTPDILDVKVLCFCGGFHNKANERTDFVMK